MLCEMHYLKMTVPLASPVTMDGWNIAPVVRVLMDWVRFRTVNEHWWKLPLRLPLKLYVIESTLG